MKLKEKLKRKLKRLRRKLKPFKGLAWLLTLVSGIPLLILSFLTTGHFYTKLLLGELCLYWSYSLFVSDTRDDQIWSGIWFIDCLVLLILLVVWF
ncbi:hypothetical protein DRN75_04250 [Nanoarchaeota archaeon]|nr:MAG: hypothetical protein DRN75_04250 [Nanoarchaeota archaeon]